jgi:iron complex transport system substrate-binding protein
MQRAAYCFLIGSLLSLLNACNAQYLKRSFEPQSDIQFTPTTVKNCNLELVYQQPPKRVVTMNQSATEVMLALGLEQQMVGTAYTDDTILPTYQQAYAQIPILAAKYPSQEILLGVEPDFIYAALESAFAKEAAGIREDLLKLKINSYLSPVHCSPHSLRPKIAKIDHVHAEIREIARIFGVEARADKLIEVQRSQLTQIQQKLGTIKSPKRIFWYDSEDPPLTVSCCGMPNQIIELAGGKNLFKDIQSTQPWVTVNWEDVIDRDPDVIVLIDANWSPAVKKRQFLLDHPAYSRLRAVRNQQFIVLSFNDALPGVRNVDGVGKLAKALYPERFK